MPPNQADKMLAEAFALQTDKITLELENLKERAKKLEKLIEPSAESVANRLIASAEAADGDMRTLPSEDERLRKTIIGIIEQINGLLSEQTQTLEKIKGLDGKIKNLEDQLSPDDPERN